MSDDQPNEQRQKLEQIVSGFDTAMLVTTGDDDLIRARPMHITARKSETELWFLSARDSAKVEEMKDDFRAAVVMQDKRVFAFLSGMVSIKDDEETLEGLWSVAMRPWFPEGPSGDKLVAIRFVPIEGEYWDTSGIEGIKYVFKAVKAAVFGETPDIDSPEMHGAVTL